MYFQILMSLLFIIYRKLCLLQLQQVLATYLSLTSKRFKLGIVIKWVLQLQ